MSPCFRCGAPLPPPPWAAPWLCAHCGVQQPAPGAAPPQHPPHAAPMQPYPGPQQPTKPNNDTRNMIILLVVVIVAPLVTMGLWILLAVRKVSGG